MNSSPVIRLLLVDDHTIVREGFAALLRLQPDFMVAGEAGTGKEAIHLFRTIKPDVTLVDLSLPDMDGATAIRTIRAEFPDACLAALTTFDNDERIRNALAAGARMYLIKTVSLVDLCEVIRALAAGAPLPQTARKRRQPGAGREALTRSEHAVLALMVAGDTNETIARELGVSINTVKSHVCAVLRKLRVGTRTGAVALALELGVVDRPARPENH